MLAASLSNSAEREMSMTSRTHKLEIAYNACLKSTAILHGSENARRLRFKIALLEQDNEDLREEASHQKGQIDDLYSKRDGLSDEVAAAKKLSEIMRIDLRGKSRQVEILTAELHLMKRLSSDSSKILSEKLALSRELSALKPQMEHLQAQLISNQNVLAEKLSLQRELSAVQVELENQKRLAENARNQEPEGARKAEKLEKIISKLKSELTKEMEIGAETQKDAGRVADEYEGKIDLLETRLNAFRTKLKSTKEQLQDCQERLNARHSTVSTATTLRESTDNTTGTIANFRKRSLAQVDPDATVGTPGDQQPNKRGKRGSTLPGEKSTFSITPFLNKTGGGAPDGDDDTPSRAPVDAKSQEKTVHESLSKKAMLVQTKTTDGPSSTELNPKLKPKRSTLKLARSSNLDQVVEENDENEQQEQTETSEELAKPVTTESSAASEPPIMKKKRKLIGKTLFDDADDEPVRHREDSMFGKSTLSALGRAAGGKPAIRLGPRVSSRQGSAFGAFSPLKRDRSLLAG